MTWSEERNNDYSYISAIKLPLAIEDLSNVIVAVALFVTMVSSIILGIGVPTPAAYMLVAVGAVPSLLNMGVPLLAAHLYCFYFAILSKVAIFFCAGFGVFVVCIGWQMILIKKIGELKPASE